jgi:hypothetical protein
VPFDSGPVLPYLIGRALHGNITAVASTDEMGRAHAELTYTVNNVGDSLAIWAQGDGIDRVKDVPKRVTAAGTLVYPGVAPATLWAAPDPIFGNARQRVTVCVADALGIPLRGMQVSFAFELPAGGTGTVDGRASGSFANLTGVNGCAVGEVETSGVPATDGEGGVSGTLVIGAAGQTTSIGIVVQIAALQADPNSVPVACSGTSRSIRITARSAQGAAVPNTPISGSCSASGGANATISLTPANANTNADGVATFNVRASGFVGAGSDGGPPTVGEGQCTFTAPGNRSVTVDFRGFATAEDFSPPDAGCGAG